MKPEAVYFNSFNDHMAIKWAGLSDGGKWTRAIDTMEGYTKKLKDELDAKQKRIEELEKEIDNLNHKIRTR